MLFLLLSILCSTLIVLIFKLFNQHKVNTFNAIVVNYFVCVICGSLVLAEFPFKIGFWEKEWFPYALLLGALFISGFYVVGKTVQEFGITAATILQKMSIILSVSFGIWMYQEATPLLKLVGIVLALVAVVLSNYKNKKGEEVKHQHKYFLWFLPAFTFLSSGVIEILLQYVEKSVVSTASDPSFTVFLFGTAGTIGFTALIISLLLKKNSFSVKDLIAGILLGIPNYGSIYFLLRVLGNGQDVSVVLPINNVGIIVLSALLSILFFKERLSKLNVLGVAIAIISIAFIALAQ